MPPSRQATPPLSPCFTLALIRDHLTNSFIAPTWRGPLPTMMNGHRPWFDRICRLVDLPIVGPLLYGLNVNRLVIRYMAAGHVYSDARWLRGERLREKLAVTRSSGSRFSSVRFVTGKLDPLTTRTEFLD